MTDEEQPRLTLLGGFELWLPGRGVQPVPARKAKALLSFLALNPTRPQSRDRLATLLWGEKSQAQARHSLRQALAGLRKVLLDSRCLDTTAEHVTLAGVDVDVLRFSVLANESAAPALERAVALYSGELLEGFDARAPGFEDWLSVERSRLRELAVTAMARLLERQREGRSAESAVRLALRLLALDPLRESAHRELMQAYALLGRAQDAVRQYRGLRRLLHRELHVEPEATTTALYRRILAERAATDDAAETRAAAGLPSAETARQSSEMPVVSAEPEHARAGREWIAGAETRADAKPELRQLTVLAVRWRPPPALAEADPEELRRAETLVAERLALRAHDLGCELLGEGLGGYLLAFGRTRVRSDDCERALYAAVELRGALAQAPGGGFGAAVHCGQALCERLDANARPDAATEAAPSGVVLHQAAEMARVTADGEIWLSEAVRRSVQRWADVEPISPERTDPDAAPEGPQCWRLRTLSAVSRRAEVPLVGRRRELGLLCAGLDALAEVGGGHTVLIRGEAGIGKTRLLDALRSEADARGIEVSVVRVLDFGAGTAAEAPSVLLRGLLGLAPDAPVAMLTRALADTLESGGLSGVAMRAIGPLIGIADAGDTVAAPMSEASRAQAQCRAMAALLSAVTQTRPRLIVVEDIHWATPPVLAFLATLAEATARSAAMLAMTTRFEGEPLDPGWRAAMHGVALTTIDLVVLTPEQCLELAQHFIDEMSERARAEQSSAAAAAGEDTERIRRFVERSAGNPLFLQQLMLTLDDQRDEASPSAGAESVPDAIQRILLARLDALPSAERETLQAAAVLGQRLHTECLGELIERPDCATAAAGTHPLLRRDGAELVFSHALIRDAVYASLPGSRRRLLHQAAANWYQTRDPVLHARHLAKAGAQGAAAAHLEAARLLVERGTHDGAAGLAEDGIALTKDSILRRDLALLAAEALYRAGHTEKARGRFEEVVVLAESAGQVVSASHPTDTEILARALLGRAMAETLLDEPEAALTSLTQASASARLAGDSALAADIRFQRGNALFNLARLDDCLKEHLALADYARASGSLRHQALAEGGLGDAHYLRGQMITANAHFARCVRLAEQAGLESLVPSNLAMQTWTAFFANRVAAGIADAERALELSRAQGDPRAESLAYAVLVPLLLGNNQLPRARALAERALSTARAIGSPRQVADHLCGLAEAQGMSGDHALAMVLLSEAQAELGDVGVPYAGAVVLGLQARFCADPRQRCSYIAQGEEILTRTSISHNLLQFHHHAIEALLAARDLGRIEHHAQALADYTRREPLPWCEFHIRRARVLVAAIRDGVDDTIAQELRALMDQAKHAGLNAALPMLERAAADLGGEPNPR